MRTFVRLVRCIAEGVQPVHVRPPTPWESAFLAARESSDEERCAGMLCQQLVGPPAWSNSWCLGLLVYNDHPMHKLLELAIGVGELRRELLSLGLLGVEAPV